jgi:hypothetical protein
MTESNDGEPTNLDIFNLIVIFAELYKSFPIPTMIRSSSLATQLLGEHRYLKPHHSRGITQPEDAVETTDEGDRYEHIAFHSISWLTRCGFMTEISTQWPDIKNYVLTPKGFEALAAVPTSLNAKETRPLGKQLTSAAATVGDRASTAVISNIVGQVIGAAARSLMS